jgi:hypothetical protein
MGLPLKAERVTVSPFWSGRVKSGAFWLTSMILYLYRKWWLAVTLAAVAAAASPLGAQVFRAPQPERTTPRAVGVLETFSNGVRRLVPVSFYFERHYYDATFYHATPVPLALEPGTVYEVQRAGTPEGTFTLQRAAQRKAEWFAVGYSRKAPDKTLAAKKAAAAAAVVRDPSRPVLHRAEGSQGDRPAPQAAVQPSAPSPGEDDPNRPHLHRTPNAAEVEAQAEAPVEDAGRPVLRRGKPEENSSGEESSENSAPGISPLTVERQVAVSDAGTYETQDVSFPCDAAQRLQIEAAARRLAEEELRRQAPRRGLSMLPAPELALAFEDVQFALYSLDYSNYATVVFSGRYRPPLAAGGAEGGDHGSEWVVTVIARQEPDRMVQLYAAVSDPRALGLYPELRLVDAVDPDGYGRYALLFRERKRDGVSWLLARSSGYGLETLFETPER